MVSGAALGEETQSKRRPRTLRAIASNRLSPPRPNYHAWCQGVCGGTLFPDVLVTADLYLQLVCVFMCFLHLNGKMAEIHFTNHTCITVSDGTDGQVSGLKSPAREQDRTRKGATVEQLGLSPINI